MRSNLTFGYQLLALVLAVPSVWVYVHGGSDLFDSQRIHPFPFDTHHFWVTFTAPFVWLFHGVIIIIAVSRPIIEFGRRSSEEDKTDAG